MLRDICYAYPDSYNSDSNSPALGAVVQSQPGNNNPKDTTPPQGLPKEGCWHAERLRRGLISVAVNDVIAASDVCC